MKCTSARRKSRVKGRKMKNHGGWIQFAIWVTSVRHLSHKRICLIGESPSIWMGCLQLVNLYSPKSHPPSAVTVWSGQDCQPLRSYLILKLDMVKTSVLHFFCICKPMSAFNGSQLPNLCLIVGANTITDEEKYTNIP